MGRNLALLFKDLVPLNLDGTGSGAALLLRRPVYNAGPPFVICWLDS
jgi:hypothetical protein